MSLLIAAHLQVATWGIGDAEHPWHLHPVSLVLTTGESYEPQFDWGGSFAAEVIVDDDGDGLIDEDPVDLIDNDGTTCGTRTLRTGSTTISMACWMRTALTRNRTTMVMG
jgi:hypothetical protein